jgi:hypothetical protein
MQLKMHKSTMIRSLDILRRRSPLMRRPGRRLPMCGLAPAKRMEGANCKLAVSLSLLKNISLGKRFTLKNVAEDFAMEHLACQDLSALRGR